MPEQKGDTESSCLSMILESLQDLVEAQSSSAVEPTKLPLQHKALQILDFASWRAHLRELSKFGPAYDRNRRVAAWVLTTSTPAGMAGFTAINAQPRCPTPTEHVDEPPLGRYEPEIGDEKEQPTVVSAGGLVDTLFRDMERPAPVIPTAGTGQVQPIPNPLAIQPEAWVTNARRNHNFSSPLERHHGHNPLQSQAEQDVDADEKLEMTEAFNQMGEDIAGVEAYLQDQNACADWPSPNALDSGPAIAFSQTRGSANTAAVEPAAPPRLHPLPPGRWHSSMKDAASSTQPRTSVPQATPRASDPAAFGRPHCTKVSASRRSSNAPLCVDGRPAPPSSRSPQPCLITPPTDGSSSCHSKSEPQDQRNATCNGTTRQPASSPSQDHRRSARPPTRSPSPQHVNGSFEQNEVIDRTVPLDEEYDWEVRSIKGRSVSGGVERFLVDWAPSRLAQRYVQQDEDGEYIAFATSTVPAEWGVCEWTAVEGSDMCDVEWVDTWEKYEGLKRAKDAVQEFLEDWRNLPALYTPQHKVTRITHRKFMPEGGKDHRLAFRELLKRLKQSTTLRKYPKRLDRRTLTFRGGHRRPINAGKSERRRAVLVFMTGIRQTIPCECCQAGCGPFADCIVSENDFNRACTNCAYSGDYPARCNYHRESRSEAWTPNTSDNDVLPPNEDVLPLDDGMPTLSSSAPSGCEPSGCDGFVVARSSPELGTGNAPFPTTAPIRPSAHIPCQLPSSTISDPMVLTPLALRSKEQQSEAADVSQVAGPSVHSSSVKCWDLTPPPKLLPRRHAEAETSSPAGASSQLVRNKRQRPAEVPPSVHAGASFQQSAFADQRSAKRSRPDPLPADIVEGAGSILRMLDVTTFLPGYRHPGCDTRCANAKVGHVCRDRIDQPNTRCHPTVYSGKRFKAGNATERQVGSVLYHSPCSVAVAFHDSWEEARHYDVMPAWETKEKWISRVHHSALNEAIVRFCPAPDLPRAGADVIMLD